MQYMRRFWNRQVVTGYGEDRARLKGETEGAALERTLDGAIHLLGRGKILSDAVMTTLYWKYIGVDEIERFPPRGDFWAFSHPALDLCVPKVPISAVPLAKIGMADFFPEDSVLYYRQQAGEHVYDLDWWPRLAATRLARLIYHVLVREHAEASFKERGLEIMGNPFLPFLRFATVNYGRLTPKDTCYLEVAFLSYLDTAVSARFYSKEEALAQQHELFLHFCRNLAQWIWPEDYAHPKLPLGVRWGPAWSSREFWRTFYVSGISEIHSAAGAAFFNNLEQDYIGWKTAIEKFGLLFEDVFAKAALNLSDAHFYRSVADPATLPEEQRRMMEVKRTFGPKAHLLPPIALDGLGLFDHSKYTRHIEAGELAADIRSRLGFVWNLDLPAEIIIGR